MMECTYCDWITSKKNLLYEDEHSVVLINPKPASAGHLLVLPRKHITIFEQLPSDIGARLGIIANKMSMIQFEALGAQGTNLVIQNGVGAGQTMPHLGIHLIPRKEGDGINLSWKSRPLTEEQMAAVELGLREQLENAQPPQPQQPTHEQPKPPLPPSMLKYPERIP
ncbi:MAG TPA: HIT family protein [Candidatus Nanoarchaeia archaeon]|nr:HIT family protein [Candidatus Nanoarchaeia archaeon]